MPNLERQVEQRLLHGETNFVHKCCNHKRSIKHGERVNAANMRWNINSGWFEGNTFAFWACNGTHVFEYFSDSVIGDSGYLWYFT